MVTIEGINDAMRAFEKAPEKMDKIIVTAMRSACKPVAKDIRSKTPSRFKKLVKSKVKANNNQEVEAWIGLFNGKQKNGRQGKTKVDDWFKAYWQNYGTLENRDPIHHFQSPVKHNKTRAARNRRGHRGIKARHFYPYDDGLPQSIVQQYLHELQGSLKKQEDKLL